MSQSPPNYMLYLNVRVANNFITPGALRAPNTYQVLGGHIDILGPTFSMKC